MKSKYKAIKLTIMITLILIFSPQIMLAFSSPSGQTSSIEGGGFCQGTYTVYNNTGVDNLIYAENCSTGINDIAANGDVGNVITTLFSSDMPNSGEVHLRAGWFSEVTSIVFGKSGLTLSGVVGSGFDTHSGALITGFRNGTLIVAKTAGMTMIKSTTTPSTSAPIVLDNTIKDLVLDANYGTASVGINFAMTETSSQNLFYDIIFNGPYTGSATGGFTTAMILDGNDDTRVILCKFLGGTAPNTGGALTDIQWITSSGNPFIEQSLLGGNLNLLINDPEVYLTDDIFATIKLNGNATTAITVTGGQMENNGNGLTGCRINLNGNTLPLFKMTGSISIIGTSPSNPNNIGWVCGTGKLNNEQLSGNVFAIYTGANWNVNGATIFESHTDLSNFVVTFPAIIPTNFPGSYTIDTHNFF